MPSIIEVSTQALSAELARLANQIEHAGQALKPVGEDIVERIKQRFASAADPDGVRWQANSRVTLINYIRNKGGFSKKTGKILAKGQALAISKRPLQGQTLDLASQFASDATDEGLTVVSTMIYARMQQFGGTKAQFPQLWGNIPARRFFPLTAAGELAPAEADLIVERLRQYLLDGI